MKKKLTAILMSLALTTTMISTVAPTTVVVASSSAGINKVSANKIVTYQTDDAQNSYYTTIKINGCSKKSQIKKLKSSNKNVKVTACNGYIKAVYKDKAAKAIITCTVKNKKLKTTLTVKKYTNPLKSLTLGASNLTAKFNKTSSLTQNEAYKDAQLSVQMKTNWKITSVTVWSDGVNKTSTVNKSTYSENVSLLADKDYIQITCKNTKTKTQEYITITADDTQDSNTVTPPAITTCDHEWKHVDAIGHEEQVLISDEWSEPVYDTHVLCNGCNLDFGKQEGADSNAGSHITAVFADGCARYRSEYILVDTIYHKAVYRTVWVDDEPAHDVCTKCGETKITTCDHEWKHIDAIGHEKQIPVSDEWYLPVFEKHFICNGCGEDFGAPDETPNNDAYYAALAHTFQSLDDCCDGWDYGDVQVSSIHHEAVYETIWVEDEPAYDVCTKCRKTK